MKPVLVSSRKERIVLCHGCFDVLHLGHIRHLKEARKLGDRLVVSITSDAHVAKGMGRPHFKAEERQEALRALDCVDEVVINDHPSAVEVIRSIRPYVYVKGVDYKDSADHNLEKEKKAVEAVGGRLHFTETQKWSSSRLINADKLPEGVCAYLELARLLGYRERILEAFEKADQLKIAFVGETIRDVYRYVNGLGRSSKELMLATVETGVEEFEGGVRAAAKHGEWKQTRIITHPEVITKTRYVDADFNRKIFDVYSSRRINLSAPWHTAFQSQLFEAVEESDAVIVFDFGHGLIDRDDRETLQDAGFLAVNSQSNAGNYGFNLVTKYKVADLICIDDPEARLAAQMDRAPIETVLRKGLAALIDCQKFIVTHGRHGSVFLNGQTFGDAPAFVTGGVDTMGAGDATLAVVAPLVCSGLDLDVAAFVGNVVGAIKIGIVGHRRPVMRDEIIQTVEALLA